MRPRVAPGRSRIPATRLATPSTPQNPHDWIDPLALQDCQQAVDLLQGGAPDALAFREWLGGISARRPRPHAGCRRPGPGALGAQRGEDDLILLRELRPGRADSDAAARAPALVSGATREECSLNQGDLRSATAVKPQSRSSTVRRGMGLRLITAPRDCPARRPGAAPRPPLRVDGPKGIECLIEYPHDPLPGQGINSGTQNWHSLALTASFEFSELGWSIGDSNPRTLACQAEAGAIFASSAARFEIDPQSS